MGFLVYYEWFLEVLQVINTIEIKERKCTSIHKNNCQLTDQSELLLLGS